MNDTDMDHGKDFSKVFDQLAELERKFMISELDSLRRKEFALQPLYEERSALTNSLPDFWPDVFSNPPQEVQDCLNDEDLEVLTCLRSFSVERYAIETEVLGEPRSLRFTFEFEENGYFHDTKLVKEFEYRTRENGSEGYVSRPVPISWKKKKDLTGGVLGAAHELYLAEETMKSGHAGSELDSVERESLWQYQKLCEKLDGDADERDQPSFFSLFGYRGAVSSSAKSTKATKKTEETVNGTSDESDEEEDIEEDDLLDVEIFVGGDDLALALADDLWPNVMDYFMASQMAPEDEAEELDAAEDSDEAPDLVEIEQADALESVKKGRDGDSQENPRPEKRRRVG